MKKRALLGVAVLAAMGTILTTSSLQPAQAQMLDILKNALGGQQQPATNSYYNAPYNNSYNNYGGSLNGAGSSKLSGFLNKILPGQSAPYPNNSGGNGLVNGLLPLVQTSGVAPGLLNNLQQSQYSSGYGGNYPASLSGNYFGNGQPVVFNGVSLDSGIYSGPYRGTANQVESAMNLDWAMTVLKEQINQGANQGYLMPNDANTFASELNNLIAQKQQVVGKNGLSFQDSQVLVAAINDLVGRVRQAWYSQASLNNDNGNENDDGWDRHNHKRYAQADAYGQVLSPNKNQALEDLYLRTRPVGGFRP